MNIVIRMAMHVDQAAQLSTVLCGDLDEDEQRLAEQLWLRSVFVEQRRRIRIPERAAFDARCDRILEALDPRKLSFNELVDLTQEILDRHYPADIFNTDNPIVGNDPGTRLVAALREVLAVRT